MHLVIELYMNFWIWTFTFGLLKTYSAVFFTEFEVSVECVGALVAFNRIESDIM